MKGLVLTYVIAALGTIGAFRRPLLGLYVYVGLAVLRPRFIFGWAGDLSNISLIVGVAMLIGWALNGFGSWRMGRARPVVLSLFGFTAWYALSASLAGNTDASFTALLELLKIVMPFCVGLTMLDEEKQWRTLMWVIVLAQGYVSFEMNLNYLSGYNSAADGFGGMDNNCFGVALVTVLGLAMALMLTSQKWYERAAAVVSAALILHTALLTFSRGAMIGLLAVGATAFLALPKRPKYIAGLVVTALLAVYYTGPQLMARYGTTFASADERDGSAQSRIDLWMDTIKVIQSQPLVGVGPANWRFAASRFGWTDGKSAHSVWMETAAEVGAPGTLALVLFFWIAAVRLWPLARARITTDNRYQTAAAMGVLLSVVGFVVAGQFVSVVGLEAPYYIVMIGVAVLRGTSKAQERPQQVTAGEGVSASSAPPVPPRLLPRLTPARNLTPQPQSATPRLLPGIEGARRPIPPIRGASAHSAPVD